MVRALLLLVLISLALGRSTGELTRVGHTIPVHIPTQSITSNETFEVPYWLGSFYATVDVDPTIWVLPLTIGNGGQVYPGQFLYIRNNGPEDILLYAQSPETIEGDAFLRIPADSVVGLLSGYPAWVVTSPPSVNISLDNIVTENIEIGGDVFWHDEGPLDLGSLEWMHSFVGVDAVTSNPIYTVEMGPETLNVPSSTCDGSTCVNWDTISIGRQAGAYNTARYVINLGRQAGINNTAINANNIGRLAGQFNTGFNVNNLGQMAGETNTGFDVNNIGVRAGQLNTGPTVNNIGPSAGLSNRGDTVNNIGRQAGEFNLGNRVTNIGSYSGRYNTGNAVTNIGVNAGTNNTGAYCCHNGENAGLLNTFGYCYTNGRESVCSSTNQFVFGSTTYPLNPRLPSNSGSFCMGAAYDTCLNYGRAGAWELPSGQDLYSTGYVCAGAGCTSSAPVSTATGLYDSNTRVIRQATCTGCSASSQTDGVFTFTVPPGTVTSVSGTANQVCVATGTTTPVISICPVFSWSGTSYSLALTNTYMVTSTLGIVSSQVATTYANAFITWSNGAGKTATMRVYDTFASLNCQDGATTSSAQLTPTAFTTDVPFEAPSVSDSGIRVVRSCTAGSGITCSVTDGVLTVAASIDLKNESGGSADVSNMREDLNSLRASNDLLQKRVELLEARIEKLLQLVDV